MSYNRASITVRTLHQNNFSKTMTRSRNRTDRGKAGTSKKWMSLRNEDPGFQANQRASLVTRMYEI